MSNSFFSIDPLSLFFLCVIGIVTVPSAVYALGYFKDELSGGRKTGAWALLAIFIASMAAVVTARHVFVFLVAWEIMSLTSYFLIILDSHHQRSIQAGMIYIIMTHIGTAFLVAAFFLIYSHAHAFDFSSFKIACLDMPAHLRNIVYIFFLIGFGTKAGLVPVHVWLPYAHPQAPSPISSIMSGVMIKTAVYGIIRFTLFILGISSIWWGELMLLLALLTCLVGIIYALMEHDIKRLLAYSSVENIGIILLGVGLSMLFTSLNRPYLAVFSLISGLYHLVNHAIFKGLLFLCAGSVYRSTGTRDMEKYGGLIKTMPHTAFCFLIGAMAISALPPLNGFISEWLLFQAFFLGAITTTGGGGRLFLGILATGLALTSGLAAACFVKAFGISFLAQPRTRVARDSKEAPMSMKIGMYFLTGLAILFGLGAGVIVKQLAPVAGSALGLNTDSMVFSLNNITLNPQIIKNTTLSVPLLALTLSLLGVASWTITRFNNTKRRILNNTWDCGYYKLEPRNEYTATAFSKPFRIAFGFFLLPYRKTQKIRESFYHVKSFSYETHTTPVFKKYIYEPVLTLVFKTAKTMRRLQPGSIHLYLSYIFITLLLLILFMNKF